MTDIDYYRLSIHRLTTSGIYIKRKTSYPKTQNPNVQAMLSPLNLQPGTRLKFSDSLFEFHLTAILIAWSENGEHGDEPKLELLVTRLYDPFFMARVLHKETHSDRHQLYLLAKCGVRYVVSKFCVKITQTLLASLVLSTDS